jgi:predicted short-subunit dehydrogenase-like oxidoreductase (DUF2520 family)
MRIAFVGCGAAGRPLGLAWHRAGHEIGAVLARTSAADAVREMGAGEAGGSLEDADVVVFATPDDVLEEAAAAHRLTGTQVALLLSGERPSTVLQPTGARTASLHPLRAFADLETSVVSLPQTFFFVEGEAADVAEELARDLGGQVARISTGSKTLYHAGAAVASNFTVTLLALARDLLVRAGVDEDLALDALVRLARGSVDNVAKVGIPTALTGPAARGDVAVVARHLASLDAGQRELYCSLLSATLPVARAKGGLSPDAEQALRLLLPCRPDR